MKSIFCKNCGTKIEESAEFCQNCGNKVEVPTNADRVIAKPSTEAQAVQPLYYGTDWGRRTFAVASIPYFDVMVNGGNLVLIKMPKYSGATLGLILGLLILNLLGAVIGSSMGASSDKKKRIYYRSFWLDQSNNIISTAFESDIFLKVPLENLLGNIVLGKKKFTVTYQGKKVVLYRDKKEFDRFKSTIEKYVL